jgi:hypothetical protein
MRAFREDEPMPRVTRRELLAAAPAVGVAAVLAASTEARAEVRVDQPYMEAALQTLKSARGQLDAAAPDKGGHRVKALRLVTQAIAEVEKGIIYSRRH